MICSHFSTFHPFKCYHSDQNKIFLSVRVASDNLNNFIGQINLMSVVFSVANSSELPGRQTFHPLLRERQLQTGLPLFKKKIKNKTDRLTMK